ncbi:MAG: hypothetical protein HQK49_10460 [Oligoflexia bacterium]|nr:hypothetical protein [Oligoflexia bacterium]
MRNNHNYKVINKLALIGKNISHSRSQQIYEDLLGYKIRYDLIDCSSEKDIPTLQELFIERKYQGVSITSPYKSHFCCYNNIKLSPFLRSLNIVNTLSFLDSFSATNTDIWAIQHILLEFITKLYSENKKNILILILGDGLMAKMTILLLNTFALKYVQISRKKYGNLEKFDLVGFVKSVDSKKDTVLVVNACSRDFIFNGMISEDYYFWDYNYGIDFHQRELAKKVKLYQDGLELLKLQANYALQFWSEIKKN